MARRRFFVTGGQGKMGIRDIKHRGYICVAIGLPWLVLFGLLSYSIESPIRSYVLVSVLLCTNMSVGVSMILISHFLEKGERVREKRRAESGE